MASDLETNIRRHFETGDFEATATAAVKGYGPQVLGFLVAMLNDEDAAGEVFARFCHDLWVGMAAFDWRCTFRTWAYVLARNAATRHRRDPWNRRADALDTPMLQRIEQEVRVSTLTIIRRERRDILVELRSRLDPYDRALLVLRVDKELAWDEIARVMAVDDQPHDDELNTLSATLRKRFQRVKQQLREMALAEGLD